MSGPSRSIVIVGAGFSGTTLATTLLRSAWRGPLRVVLVERAQIGCGSAYRAREYPYVLNVPAGRMSANPLDSGEFLEFARGRYPGAGGGDFLPRELYGEYLQSSLARAQGGCAPDIELRRVHALAIAIERSLRTTHLRVHLEGGACIGADTVVLALGNPPPAALTGSEALNGSARLVADPWLAPLRFRAGERLLVVGSGLTMADVVVAGAHATANRLHVHVISRHGLMPLPQTSMQVAPAEAQTAARVRAASGSVGQLLRVVRTLAENMQLQGGDWREVISCVRELVPTLWQRLPVCERRRFLRHVRSYWDLHRHRLAPSSWSALHDLRRAGRLQLHAGRILNLEPAAGRVQVTWRARGTAQVQSLCVDRVINCTGPDYDVRRTQDRLLRSLLAQGVAVRDELGQGLMVDEHGALIDASGRAAANLFYLGPLLRARDWECTAVAELREHVARLARQLLHDAAPRDPRDPYPLSFRESAGAAAPGMAAH